MPAVWCSRVCALPAPKCTLHSRKHTHTRTLAYAECEPTALRVHPSAQCMHASVCAICAAKYDAHNIILTILRLRSQNKIHGYTPEQSNSHGKSAQVQRENRSAHAEAGRGDGRLREDYARGVACHVQGGYTPIVLCVCVCVLFVVYRVAFELNRGANGAAVHVARVPVLFGASPVFEK